VLVTYYKHDIVITPVLEGAVWNYEVDATTGHLLGNAEPNTAILGADARDSVIATATTSVVSLWDHRTLKHIIDFSEGINPNSDWSAFYYRPLTQPVYLHENEVVFANSTGLCYYERRMNKLLQSIPFLLIEQRRDVSECKNNGKDTFEPVSLIIH
jgi:hypothetical protein